MINIGILIGRVTYKNKKLLPDGSKMITLSVSTSKKIKDINNNVKLAITWHRVHCFNKISDIADKFIMVGDTVYVKGEIQNKKICNGPKSGQYVYSIKASDVRFIPNSNKLREDREDEDIEDSCNFKESDYDLF